MISGLIDELNKLADGQAPYRDAREVMLRAADTICELRGALQVASVDYRHLAAENAKLRELVRWMYYRMDESCAVQHPYAPAPINYDQLMQAAVRARELGVEVS